MRFLASVLMLLTAGFVHAEDAVSDSTTTKAKMPSEATAQRKDIDEEITNKKLRAETGSKSLISLKSALGYNGGSINSPLSQERPQLSPGTTNPEPSKLSGTISAKYRVSDHDSLSLGVGVGWLTPTYQGQSGQVENPILGYNRAFKTGIIQNVIDASIVKYTSTSASKRDDIWNTNFDYTILAKVGTSRLDLGMDLGYYREFYSQTTAKNGDAPLDYVALYPFAEYELNDVASLRTVYRGFSYFNSPNDQKTFVRDDPTQSFGVGLAVTRDIYLYPNVQWVWADVRAEKTNVAISANINL